MTYTYAADVSKYQEVSDWAPLVAKNRWELIIARASIGTTPDPLFPAHIAKAKALHLMTGAYHFNWDPDYSGTATPEDQADFFAARIKAVGGVDFPNLDVEGKMAFERGEARRFIARMHYHGLRCGLYMSASQYYWDIGQDWDWVAKWTLNQTPPVNPPAGAWEFWQYTSNGKSTDQTRLDLDVFNGTLAQLRLLAQGGKTVGLNIEQEFIPPHNVTGDKGARVYSLDGSPTTSTLSDATDRQGMYKVQVDGDTTHHYYAARWPGGGPGPDLLLVRSANITDHGPVAPDTSAEDAKIASLTAQAAVKDTQIVELQKQLVVAQDQLKTAATTERQRIADAEAARIKAL